MGMAPSGPTASIALTLAATVSAANYGGPLAVLICALPMFGIALAYRRLNRWQVDCGASYTWIGRAISPYLGFIVGWIMLLGYFLGTISDVLPIGPYVLAAFAPGFQNSTFATALSAAIWLVIVTIIAYIGIRVTARFQWVLATVEYLTISVFAIVALIAVFGGNPKSASFSWSWFSWSGIGGTSGLVGGILIAVYMFSGWDTSIYVNEETQQSRVNPGRAVLISVAMLTFMYAFFTFAYQGAVKRGALLAHGGNALFYIVSTRRVAVGQGDDRGGPVLGGRRHPDRTGLGRADRIRHGRGRHAAEGPRQDRPGAQDAGGGDADLRRSGADRLVGVRAGLLVRAGRVHQGDQLGRVDVRAFYAATGFGLAVYYRSWRCGASRGFVELLAVPGLSAAFLLWVAVKSVPGLGGWGSSVMLLAYVMIGIGVLLMIVARARHQTGYFDRPIEAYEPGAARE